ncbi:hypothetical protein [Pseudomonas sp. GX19020]|nr:hypothetical protein [Pseudomonas sp. GX19020]
MRDAAIAYMRESVPDAIRALVGSDTSILPKLVQSKIGQALSPG